MKKHTKVASAAAAVTAALAAVTFAPPAPASAAVIGGHFVEVYESYTATVRESNSQFNCPTDEVLFERKHSGDENANTTYVCARIYIDNQRVSVSTDYYYVTVKESKSYYVTPSYPDQALVGRWHQGDENGNTTYVSAKLTLGGSEVHLIQRYWSGFVPEYYSAGRLSNDHEIMTGRQHSGDERGKTAYQYATVSL